jgi:2-polyprenyl-3-methyl-5-hydroxy-6-metoxy-1,4-benzoquinol methylase
MTPQIKQTVVEFIKKYKLDLHSVLEVGAMDVNGSVRQDFIKHANTLHYLGIDREPGRGVDLVREVSEITGGYEAVVCLEVLEHDPKFWETMQHIKDRIKPGGFLFISTPTIGFPYHGYPKDYYRFTEDAYRDVLLHDMDIFELRKIKDDVGQPGIIALARKFK